MDPRPIHENPMRTEFWKACTFCDPTHVSIDPSTKTPGGTLN